MLLQDIPDVSPKISSFAMQAPKPVRKIDQQAYANSLSNPQIISKPNPRQYSQLTVTNFLNSNPSSPFLEINYHSTQPKAI